MLQLVLYLAVVGLFPAIALAVPSRNTTDTSICQQLQARLPGKISYPHSSTYTNSLSSYYTDQERQIKPSCIFTPVQTSEVAQFVKIINTHGNATFAVRGGGHTLWAGAANAQDGVTVDMRSMRALVLSDDHKVASVGGGAIFSHLYPQLDQYNLTVMGGRLPGIGVGGFSTGGKSGLSKACRSVCLSWS